MSKKTKVLIIGAGATGLAAAHELQKHGVDVVIVEKSDHPGGLAGSLKVQGTDLELFYHHLFTTDKAAINLINEIGLGDKLKFYPSNNGIYYGGEIYPFSSPVDMLRFKPVNILGRLRFGVTSAYLKVSNRWKPLEKQLAIEWMNKWAGKQASDVIWTPLIKGKFADRSNEITMSWLWARIHNRSFKLGYMTGGFQQVYELLDKKITQNGGRIMYGQGVISLSNKGSKVVAKLDSGETITADQSLVTVSEPLFAKMANITLDPNKIHEHLGATCFILELDRSLIPYYWLNINDTSFPFLAVVEHSKMVGTEQYNGKHIVYIGNYIPHDDWRFTSSPEELLKAYLPYIKKINPEFKKSWIKKYHFSKAPFTQPLVTRDYASKIPSHKTSLDNVWLATMTQIYPEDRGQNYAFAMGKKVANLMFEDKNK
jgi:protoporphyrinogen oxidase